MSLWNNIPCCLTDNEIMSYKIAYDKAIVWLKANSNLKGTQEYKDIEEDAESYYETIHNL